MKREKYKRKLKKKKKKRNEKENMIRLKQIAQDRWDDVSTIEERGTCR